MAKAGVFWQLNSILIGVVGANVQGTTQPLLATHTVNVCSFLLAKLLYCIAVLEADDIINPPSRQQSRANYTHFWSFTAFVFGSVSSVSLVSTFSSRYSSYIILSIAWICAAIIIVAYQYGGSFMVACRWLYYEILKPFLNNIWNLFKGNMLAVTEQTRASV